MTGVVESLRQNVNDILGLRDSLGVGLKKVYFITRTWSGDEIGDGSYTETSVQMLPSPHVREFNHDVKIREGGVIKAGDVMLKMISKQTYTQESQLDGASQDPKIQRLYKVGEIYYVVISVEERHVTWNVLLRRLSAQKRD